MTKITKRMNDIMVRDKKIFLTLPRVPYPLVLDRGEGDFAYDIEGKKYIDFSSFIGVYNMGINSNAKVRAAIKKQVDKLMHNALLEFYSELPVEFAETLVRMFPPQESWKVFLSNSGTEAVEAAIKFSRLFTKRQYNMAFYNAFHGRTIGSLALTNSKIVQKEYFGPFQGAIHVPFPYCYRCPFSLEYPGCGMACVDYIKKYPLSKEVNPKEVAAFFAEPVQGEGGYVVPPMDYYKELKKILQEHDILFVADEVQAGYMRTGKFLSLDHFGVTADIYTMAKAIGAGLPLGVTIVNKKLGDIPAGSHSNTFGGNLAVIAGAYEQLKQVRSIQKKLEHDIKAKGVIALKRLKSMQESYEIVGDARGLGLMLAIELVKDKKTKEPAVDERREIVNGCFDSGLLLLEAGQSTIRIAPPVTISETNLSKGLDILEDVVRKANSKMVAK